jgi:hypothetical protein
MILSQSRQAEVYLALEDEEQMRIRWILDESQSWGSIWQIHGQGESDPLTLH